MRGRKGPESETLLERLPELAQEHQEKLEELITIQEVETAINDLPNAKATLPYGLRAEFYTKFKNVVAGVWLSLFFARRMNIRDCHRLSREPMQS